MTQSDGIGRFTTKSLYFGDSGIPGEITLGATPTSDVTCSPPVLTGSPTLPTTSFVGDTTGSNLTVPVDKAAIVNAYARLNVVDFVDFFTNDPTDLAGTDTTVSAGDATVSFFVTNAGVTADFYMDLELIDASDANCKSYYRGTDPMHSNSNVLPVVTNYRHHRLDLTTKQSRVELLTMPAVKFSIDSF